jgi:hypothetical protein
MLQVSHARRLRRMKRRLLLDMVVQSTSETMDAMQLRQQQQQRNRFESEGSFESIISESDGMTEH